MHVCMHVYMIQLERNNAVSNSHYQSRREAGGNRYKTWSKIIWIYRNMNCKKGFIKHYI